MAKDKSGHGSDKRAGYSTKKAQNRVNLKQQFAKSEWFKGRHAELTASGMTGMEAHNKAFEEMKSKKF